MPDIAASTLSASPKGATVYQQRTIYRFRGVNQADCTLRPNAEPLGRRRAWGTVADGEKLFLHQTLSFDLSSYMPLNPTTEVQEVIGVIAPNGAITMVDANGTTTGPSQVLSVVGRSGLFRALNGVAIILSYCNPTPEGTTPFVMIAHSASELNSRKEDVFPLRGVLAITAKDDQPRGCLLLPPSRGAACMGCQAAPHTF